MTKFVYAYHGGKKPETPEAGQEFQTRWRAWVADLGDAFVEPGNPVGLSKTVTSTTIEDNGGANPLSGWSVVEADNIEAACEMAKGCPHLDHGTIEVAEVMSMSMT